MNVNTHGATALMPAAVVETLTMRSHETGRSDLPRRSNDNDSAVRRTRRRGVPRQTLASSCFRNKTLRMSAAFVHDTLRKAPKRSLTETHCACVHHNSHYRHNAAHEGRDTILYVGAAPNLRMWEMRGPDPCPESTVETTQDAPGPHGPLRGLVPGSRIQRSARPAHVQHA